MKCPGCNWQMLYSRGENTKDFSCSNPNKVNECPCWTEAHFYPHMSVVPNWWFAEKYSLPFKSGARWYCICGPYNEYSWQQLPNENISEQLWPGASKKYTGTRQVSVLKEITIIQKQGILNWNNGNPIWGEIESSIQKEILRIPYMALPVNEDFSTEFNKLINHKSIDRFLNKLILFK